jgi:hypothetical protein
MSNTSTTEEYRTEEYRSPGPVLDQLNPSLEKQVAQILEATEVETEVEKQETTNTPKLGYSVPMPGVRYYAYI